MPFESPSGVGQQERLCHDFFLLIVYIQLHQIDIEEDVSTVSFARKHKKSSELIINFVFHENETIWGENFAYLLKGRIRCMHRLKCLNALITMSARPKCPTIQLTIASGSCNQSVLRILMLWYLEQNQMPISANVVFVYIFG